MMTENVEHLILEHLKYLRSTVDRLAEDSHDIKARLTNVEENLAGVNRRLDRLDQRVDRIERRLELTNA